MGDIQHHCRILTPTQPSRLASVMKTFQWSRKDLENEPTTQDSTRSCKESDLPHLVRVSPYRNWTCKSEEKSFYGISNEPPKFLKTHPVLIHDENQAQVLQAWKSKRWHFAKIFKALDQLICQIYVTGDTFVSQPSAQKKKKLPIP